MRISTSSFFNATLSGIQDQQSQIARLSQKVAENKSYLAPKEAPISASRALELSNSLALREQYAANQDKAELALKYENTLLERMYTALGDASAGLDSIVPGQDQSLRDQMAIRVSSVYNLLKDVGNSRDSQGNYIFAGHESATKPYSHTATYPSALPGTPPFASNPAAYAGDTGTRSMAVENGRQVQTSDDLSPLFLGDGSDAQDLLQALDYAAAALNDDTASEATLQSALDTASAALDRALDVLQGLQTRVAGRFIEIGDLRTTTTQLKTAEQNALADLSELDTTAAIIELQQRQTNLEASQQTFALVSSLSLFSYLG